MQRTTIMLPRDLKALAQRQARKLGISLGDLIRHALAATLQVKNHAQEPDPFFSDQDFYDGPCPPDGAANLDRYLYGEVRRDLH